MKANTTTKLTDSEYSKVVQLRKEGMPEWKAVCVVLDILEETNFVTMQAGTASKPEEGLFVRFL